MLWYPDTLSVCHLRSEVWHFKLKLNKCIYLYVFNLSTFSFMQSLLQNFSHSLSFLFMFYCCCFQSIVSCDFLLFYLKGSLCQAPLWKVPYIYRDGLIIFRLNVLKSSPWWKKFCWDFLDVDKNHLILLVTKVVWDTKEKTHQRHEDKESGATLLWTF